MFPSYRPECKKNKYFLPRNPRELNFISAPIVQSYTHFSDLHFSQEAKRTDYINVDPFAMHVKGSVTNKSRQVLAELGS